MFQNKKKEVFYISHIFISIVVLIVVNCDISIEHLQIIFCIYFLENVLISFLAPFFNLYQIFLGTSFIFLYSRIFLDLFQLCDYRVMNLWENSYMTESETHELLIVIIVFLSAISLAWVYHQFMCEGKQKKNICNFSKVYVSKAGNAIQLIFYILIFLLFLKYLLIVKLVRDNGYLFLYNGGISEYRFPLILRVKTLAEVMFPIVLFYRREKRNVFINSTLFLFTQSISLFTGQRGPAFVTLILILWIYSQYYKKIKVKYLIIISAISIFIIQYILWYREGGELQSMLYRFLYSQGISLLVIAGTIRHLSAFTNEVPFLLGTIYDFLQELFINNLGSGQTLERITYGNRLGDHLTYNISIDTYFRGNGTGSSIIAEFYELAKGNLWLLFLISCIFMIIILFLSTYLYKNIFLFVLIYYIIFYYIYSPRGMLLGWVKYFFWSLPLIALCKLIEGRFYTSLKNRNLQIFRR